MIGDLIWILVLGLGGGVILGGVAGLVADDPWLNWSQKPWWWVVVIAVDVFGLVHLVGDGHWGMAALSALFLLATLAFLCSTLARRYEVRT